MLEIVKIMTKNGADINNVNKAGQTTLMAAVSNGISPDIVKFLLDQGAKVNATDSEGKTALFYAVNYYGPRYQEESEDTKEVNARIIQSLNFLKKAGANTNYSDNNGFTSINYANRSGYYFIAEALKKLGAKE
ncbi:MAG: ankyrin repeat domain-containing protein [Planctomycetes bacterium]|nr:ankyrin repeat domain-containing protein [Planctomycetota bacterium]